MMKFIQFGVASHTECVYTSRFRILFKSSLFLPNVSGQGAEAVFLMGE